MPSPGTLLPGLLALTLAVPASAHAAGGGTAPAPVPAPDTPSSSSDSGGTRFGDAGRRPARKPAGRRRSPRPVLELFRVDGKRFYDRGRRARVTFQIRHRRPTVHVRLHVRRAASGERLATIDLGERPTGSAQTARISGRESGSRLPSGNLELRISARDARGQSLRRGAHASAVDQIEFRTHRFPVAGPYTYGGDGSRFGAPRSGHTHQGQDLAAAEGTPIVAPHAGTVTNVAYQASSAGHYVVLDSFDENRNYVFMHMQTGSVAVREGQRVRTGQLIGKVGNTGASSGPHLHFEIWQGVWQGGGTPVDPLPLLQRWDAWS